MANGKIIQLKELDDLSTPIYPVTKADAVYLQNGSLLTDYLRGFPQTTIGAANQPIYLNNGVLTAGNEVYSKQEIDNLINPILNNSGNNTKVTQGEMRIGTWIDGSPLYRRFIQVGKMPSNASLYVKHGITDWKFGYINMSMSFWQANGNYSLTNQISWNYSIVYCEEGFLEAMSVSPTQIYIHAGNIQSSEYSLWVCVEYTKK